MGTFKTVSATAFKKFQCDSGVLLSTFDPSKPAAPADTDIICATTGDISVSVVPTFVDYGSDVNNCPENVLELKKLTSWLAKLSFTALEASADVIELALAAATKTTVAKSTNTSAYSKFVPDADLATTDFKSSGIWWVGDTSDGGAVAVKLSNALSTAGLSLTAKKDAKGNLSIELTGHYSISKLKVAPVEIYTIDPAS